ncbi:MAG: hypothetical protein GX220_07180 [Treponema sp.]|nr:hypothetical protein [Treponema sp.]
MKVLIVAETDFIMENFSDFFSKQGYSVIKYRWLMKALDNVEEIEPQIVVLSALDYPRHWKTFVQFVSCNVLKYKPKIILVVPEDFTDEEKEKAQILNIKKIVRSTEELKIDNEINEKTIEQNQETKEQTDLKIPQIINESKENKPLNTYEKKIETLVVKVPEKNNIDYLNVPSLDDIKFILTEPDTNKIVTGKVVKFDYPDLVFVPSDMNVLSKLYIDQIIPNCTLKTGKFVETMRSQVRNTNQCLELCLLK